MFQYDLNPYLKNYKEYMELRVQENKTQFIQLVNGNITRNSNDSSKGVSARVFKQGAWGFSSASEVNNSSINKVINSAYNNAIFLNSKLQHKANRYDPTTPNFTKSYATTKQRLTPKEKIDFLKDIDNYLSVKYPNLMNKAVILYALDTIKTLGNSDGARYSTYLPRTSLYLNLVIENEGNPYSILVPFYGLGEFEDNFTTIEKMQEKIEEYYVHLVKKSEGVYPAAGLKECILDPRLAGILAHEAIGHTTEADLVMSGSIAGQYLNKQIASPLVSIIDYAHTMNGKLCPVPIFVDDEGTEAKDVTIIDKGILKSFMHNKESARLYGVKPMGNGRAYGYNDEPLIRMRNTVIVPGESTLDEMIASIEDGYYLVQSNNGQADSTSEFMFGVTLGYEIKNGKITRAIKDTTISGVAVDVLQSVSMVSNHMHWSMGNCGKKQPASVGMGGPAIKCRINLGGR